MPKKVDLRETPERLFSLSEASGILRLSPKTLQRRIASGALPVIRDGRLVRVHPADLKRYIGARRCE